MPDFAPGDRVQLSNIYHHTGTVMFVDTQDGTSYFVKWDDNFGPDRGGFNGTIEAPLNLRPVED